MRTKIVIKFFPKKTEEYFMKYFLILFISISHLQATTIRGKVTAPHGCNSKNVMVWLSTVSDDFAQRTLLMHTEVPNNGSFEFYVKPGHYEVRGTSSEGCGFIERVKVLENQKISVKVKLQDK
jgi:hypothetical protein